MQFLKQNIAATIKLGPFVNSTDGVTPETALTISQADIRLSKNGGDFAQTNNVAGATHDENGYYDVPLDTTDTNTLGRLIVAVNESGALPVWQELTVLVANVFDSLISGSDNLQTDAIEISSSSAAANNVESNIGNLDAAISTVATATALTTAQNDLDILTGSDGATLATSQPNYAPSVAGDEMDLIDAPNTTAITAIQSGLATATSISSLNDISVDDIFAKKPTVGGVVTFQTVINALYSMARGKIVKTNDTYVFYDDDNATALVTFTIDPNLETRTPS